MINAYSHSVSVLTFSDDGKLLATYSYGDSKLQVWQVRVTSALVLVWNNHKERERERKREREREREKEREREREKEREGRGREREREYMRFDGSSLEYQTLFYIYLY